MSDRRRFLQVGVAGTAALLAGCASPSATDEKSGERPEPGNGAAPAKGLKPVLLSTWDHGMRANARAWEVMSAGSALDAAEQGVMVVESDFTSRSVGLGGDPDRDGHTTLDACIQDHDGKCGSVAFLEEIEHPVSVARAIMERTPHVMLVGEGAQRWALENGFALKQVTNPEARAAYEAWLKTSHYASAVNRENVRSMAPTGANNHDTIGLLAMDADGHMAGSCTTSGLSYKIHGRVGDSPIIGAGLFVDGEVGGACATGTGELVIRIAGSHTVVELMRQGVEPIDACKEAVRRILKFLKEPDKHQVGFLALRADGVHGAWSIQKGFNYALRTAQGAELLDAGFTWAPAPAN